MRQPCLVQDLKLPPLVLDGLKSCCCHGGGGCAKREVMGVVETVVAIVPMSKEERDFKE